MLTVSAKKLSKMNMSVDNDYNCLISVYIVFQIV